jgi:hypothetical protein
LGITVSQGASLRLIDTVLSLFSRVILPLPTVARAVLSSSLEHTHS